MAVPGSCLSRTSRREASCSASESTRTSGLNLRNVARSRSFSRSARVSATLRGSRRRAGRAECGEQSGFLLLRLVQMASLDVAEAADVLGYARDLRGEISVLAVQVLEQLGDGRLVLGDQAPFGLALRAHAEDIEGRAAQALQFRENAERRHHPGPELRLPRLAGARIGLVEDRRSKVELQPVATFEHAFDLSRKPGIGGEARHFVLGLVG